MNDREYTGAGRYPGYRETGRFEGIGLTQHLDKLGCPIVHTGNYAWTLEEAFENLEELHPNAVHEVVEHDSKGSNRGDGCITHFDGRSIPFGIECDTPSWNRFNRVFVVPVTDGCHYRHQEVWVNEVQASPTYILVSRVNHLVLGVTPFEEWETMVFRCDEHGNATDSAYHNPLYDHRGNWEPMVVSVRKMIQESSDE